VKIKELLPSGFPNNFFQFFNYYT